MLEASDTCAKCGNHSSMMCQRCGEGYCSTQCQYKDWPSHKYICKPIPALIPATTLYAIDRAQQQQQQKPNTGSSSGRRSSQNLNTDSALLTHSKTLSPKNINASLVASPTPKVVNTVAPSAAPISEKLPIDWKTCMEPSQEKPISVVVKYIDETFKNILYVMELQYVETFKKMQSYIMHYVEKSSPLSPAIIEGALLIGLVTQNGCEKIAYRVEVLEVLNSSGCALVRLIDCGAKMKINYNNLYAPIKKFAEKNAFACCLKVARERGDNIEIGAELQFRLSGTKSRNGALIAQLIPSMANTMNKLPVALLESKIEIKLKTLCTDLHTAVVQLLAPASFYGNIYENMVQESGDTNLKYDITSTDKYVCAKRSGDGNNWCRAYLIDFDVAHNLYLVFQLDEGCVTICNAVKCIPQGLCSHPAYSFAISTEDSNSLLKLKTAKNISLQLLAFPNEAAADEANNLKCAVYVDGQKLCQVMAMTYKMENKDFYNLVLTSKPAVKDKTKVYITHVLNVAEFYVNSVECKAYGELFNLLATKCSKYTCNDMPSVNDVVLVKSADRSFRAKIEVVATDEIHSTYKVINLDTGSKHDVKLSDMFKPNDFVRFLPSLLLRIKLTILANVPQQALEQKSEALIELYKHFENGAEFELVRDSNNPEYGLDIFHNNETPIEVNLLFNYGGREELGSYLLHRLFRIPKEVSKPTARQTIAEKIEQSVSLSKHNACTNIINEEHIKSLPPSPPDSPRIQKLEKSIDLTKLAEALNEDIKENNIKKKDITRFTMSDVQFNEIPLGDGIQIVVLDVSMLTKCGFISGAFFANRNEMMEFEKRGVEINSYGNCPHRDVPDDYMPRENEVCLALFDEDKVWYRAQCLESKADEAIVMFLEYGNISKASKGNLLPIPKDMLFKIYGNQCYIDGYEVGGSNDVIELFLSQKTIFQCKVCDGGSDGVRRIQLKFD